MSLKLKGRGASSQVYGAHAAARMFLQSREAMSQVATPAPFIENSWYMAGWSEELGAGKLLARTIIEQPLVLFRDEGGQALALQDRCPHRFAPLRLGAYVPSGRIRCGYHGLEFDGSGRCVANPHGQGAIPAAARVNAFLTAERQGIVWVWMGVQHRADPGQIPDFSEVSAEVAHVARRYLFIRANYLLESDNILDLSHIQFLHPGTLASASVANAVPKIDQEGNTIVSRRFIAGDQLPPFLGHTFQIPKGARADRWLDVRWDPPASLLQTISIAVSGAAREDAVTIRIPHIFTPETRSTTHYWFASCMERGRYIDGDERVRAHVEGLTRPFATEDRPMLEAQQEVIGNQDFWELAPVLLRGDEAAIRARRLVDKLIGQESELSC